LIFAHSSIIQEGEAALFYRFNRVLNGYMIAGVFVAPNIAAKLDFATVWKYFVSEIVQGDDIYCSVPLGLKNSLFENYLSYHDTIEGLKIYKVDNYLKTQYSSYSTHIEKAGDTS
tara:strand:- start:456 stop:800 length:345 start_codon:yes stop_codon:yes gene_type:complete